MSDSEKDKEEGRTVIVLSHSSKSEVQVIQSPKIVLGFSKTIRELKDGLPCLEDKDVLPAPVSKIAKYRSWLMYALLVFTFLLTLGCFELQREQRSGLALAVAIYIEGLFDVDEETGDIISDALYDADLSYYEISKGPNELSANVYSTIVNIKMIDALKILFSDDNVCRKITNGGDCDDLQSLIGLFISEEDLSEEVFHKVKMTYEIEDIGDDEIAVILQDYQEY
ncbi:hypothetical protein P0082_08875 [Candidatus Haliotispira prima]|uniref:Uncharacterized protein n=1 Tax=Candidatus Haliotispira prima TaxID=3034016 RepID=A0ABY8MGD0_9SPIO|nr:hypothetical protein P0082_08875 [Candidatus Haliotispira prima]